MKTSQDVTYFGGGGMGKQEEGQTMNNVEKPYMKTYRS